LFIEDSIVISNEVIAENTFVIKVQADNLADGLKPGQFFNILVNDSSFPLLRRPFSICDVHEDAILFMYKVVGEGTSILSGKKPGDKLNILGPLGNSFKIAPDAEHLLIIGGGIGIAPFPFLLSRIPDKISFSVLFGVRNINEVHSFGLKNVEYSSDDGSVGYHGNIIQLLRERLQQIENKKIQIAACGPNPMLRNLQSFVMDKDIDCIVSMESAMACGFGICQGCPIEYNEEETYKLICKDGPVFDIKNIVI
jgi:dihydroorotate dehydrogenase electron transfer subunit